MNEAWWIPFYDVSLTENEARLTMMANVFNRTGQDWDNINMEISTASLKPIKLMKPTPTILQEYVPPMYSRRMSGKITSGTFGGAPQKPLRSAPTSSLDSDGEIAFYEKEVGSNIMYPKCKPQWNI